MKWFLFVLVLICNTAGAFQSIVILPFSNKSDKEQIYWLGEGFAESLSEEVLLHDALVLQRRQRQSAYEELHLPYIGELSRATMLKIGNNLSVDYVVFGSFNLKDDNLEVEMKVIKTSSSELSQSIQATGSLDRLYQVQIALRDGLLRYFNEHSIQAESEKAFPDETVPLHAYELYIKGLLENSDVERVKFLQKAVEANPGYQQAAYRLGYSLFRMQRYAESADSLKTVTFQGPYKDRSIFLIGMDSFYSGDYTGAYMTWLDLAKTRPTPEVYTNIGLALMKKEDLQGCGWYLSKAAELDPTKADYHFNLAASYVQRSFDKQAVDQYREVLLRKPADYQSLYLIQKLLERDTDPVTKDTLAKRVQQSFQDALPAEQRGHFPEQYSSVVQLVRPSESFLTDEERDYERMAGENDLNERTGIIKAYQLRAASYLDKGDASSAILEIKKGASLSPLDWYLQYLWARAYLLQKNQSAAITSLEFSIWCQDNAQSQLMLAEIFRDAEQYAEAKTHIQRSLVLDPQNKKAQEIWGKIWDKQ